MPPGKQIALGREVIRLEAEALGQLSERLDQSFVDAVELIYACKGRIVVTGLGKSGAIGRKISATLASTGTSSYFLHAADGVHGDLGVVHRDDVVICLSKSGNSDELSSLLPVFNNIGVPIIAITANPDSTLARHSKIVLNIGNNKEACPHDLAPTTSTTAMLGLGDALAIVLLEKRQFTRQDFAFLHPAGTLGKRLLTRVADLMEKGDKAGVLSVNGTMKEAIIVIASKRGICAIVDEKQLVVGVVTNGDFNRLVEHTERFFHIPVKDVMNQSPKTISVDALAYTAYQKMNEHRIIAMPVVGPDNELRGMIHLHDIISAGIT